MNKRGQITLKEVGYLLLALLVVGAILMAVSRGCNIIQSEQQKAQAEGTLTQFNNFLDSVKEGQQGNFLIYSPKGFYLTSFTEKEAFYSCSTNCLCICETPSCLTDQSYCRDIKKPVIEPLKGVPIGLGSLLVKNNADSYQIFIAQYDTSNEQVVNITGNCSGPIVPLIGDFQIRQSVKPAFDEAQKYARSLGRELIVTSAYRPVAYQSELLANLGPGVACTPKATPLGFGMNCPHVLGCAIDVHFNTTLALPKSTQNGDTLLLRKIMEHAGFTGFPLDSGNFEFWHFNYGLSTTSSSNNDFLDIKANYPGM